MPLGIFGGTFDPIHTGHLIVARAALETLGLDEVLFVPAGRPWMKDAGAVSSAEDRARMTELAVAGDPQFRVSRLEIERARARPTPSTPCARCRRRADAPSSSSAPTPLRTSPPGASPMRSPASPGLPS